MRRIRLELLLGTAVLDMDAQQAYSEYLKNCTNTHQHNQHMQAKNDKEYQELAKHNIAKHSQTQMELKL